MADRLYRSRVERKLAGVCGGIADYFDLDPSLVRILFVLLAFFNGFGIVAYIVCWIVLPEQPLDAQTLHPPVETTSFEQEAAAGTSLRRTGPNTKRWATGLGILLIAVGFAILVERFVPWLDFGDLLPYLLILAGIALLYRGWNLRKQEYRSSTLEDASNVS